MIAGESGLTDRFYGAIIREGFELVEFVVGQGRGKALQTVLDQRQERQRVSLAGTYLHEPSVDLFHTRLGFAEDCRNHLSDNVTEWEVAYLH